MIKRGLNRFVLARRKTWGASLAAVIVIAAGGSAQAGQGDHRYRDRVSGTAAPSSFDSNGDGVRGHYVTFAGRSNLGLVHGGIMVEYDFLAVAPDPACPAPMLKLPVLVSAGTRALTVTGGLIYMQDDAASALFCLDPTTGEVNMSLKGIITGGLGKFEGATGDYEYKGPGNVLLIDNAGMPFGAFELETKGTIVLPNRPRR